MTRALITTVELQQDRLESGDAAIILKRDGSFRVVQCHPKEDVAVNALTDVQVKQGTALIAFSFMLREPEIMSIVAGMASELPVLNRGGLH